jgi:hypothetical protein
LLPCLQISELLFLLLFYPLSSAFLHFSSNCAVPVCLYLLSYSSVHLATSSVLLTLNVKKKLN